MVEKEEICFLKTECFLWGRGNAIYLEDVSLDEDVCFNEKVCLLWNVFFDERPMKSFMVLRMKPLWEGFFFLGVLTAYEDWVADVAEGGSRTKPFFKLKLNFKERILTLAHHYIL